MADPLARSMAYFKAQLEDGRIIEAYQGLTAFFRDLRSHFEINCPQYEVPGSIYFGYLDMTYFSILTPTLKNRLLKVAVVLVYQPFRFEVWLSGRNRKVQEEVSRTIQQAGWQVYPLTPDPGKADSVLSQVLIEDPEFSDLKDLTARIEKGTLEFIQAVEAFFSGLAG
ncbi:MAG: DUF7000 family protein [Anaerolineales bacterium]